jgi:dipeptidyl aminopeptidase/acylaminoacyl peptidase
MDRLRGKRRSAALGAPVGHPTTNVGDWGGGDFRDLMAGVDAVVAMGIADPDRLGVMG